MKLKQFIIDEGLRLGFSKIGIAPAEYDPEHHNKFLSWLKNSYHAGMSYLERGSRKRFDPRVHIPGAASVIVCAHNYYNSKEGHPDSGHVSIYARGDDYHTVLRDKLNTLCNKIKNHYGDFNFRIFVDSSPFSEKTFAVRAGIGFVGRNGLVIIPKYRSNDLIMKGSFYFLGVIITDLDLEPDLPVEGTCGKCRRCIDACPTDAILEGKDIDVSKCISYHTTQSRGDIPEHISAEMDNMIFGCDICQTVCPYNSNAVETTEPRFFPKDFLLNFDIESFLEIDENNFRERFENTALYDMGLERLKKNIRILLNNEN
jgi:epoxyqueuosine reductase